jgi:hypothetical protein
MQFHIFLHQKIIGPFSEHLPVSTNFSDVTLYSSFLSFASSVCLPSSCFGVVYLRFSPTRSFLYACRFIRFMCLNCTNGLFVDSFTHTCLFGAYIYIYIYLIKFIVLHINLLCWTLLLSYSLLCFTFVSFMVKQKVSKFTKSQVSSQQSYCSP